MAILIIFAGTLLFGGAFVCWLCLLSLCISMVMAMWGDDLRYDILGVCVILFWVLAPIFCVLAIVKLLA